MSALSPEVSPPPWTKIARGRGCATAHAGDVDVHRLRVAVSHVPVGSPKSKHDSGRSVRCDDPVDGKCRIETDQDDRHDADNRRNPGHSHNYEATIKKNSLEK